MDLLSLIRALVSKSPPAETTAGNSKFDFHPLPFEGGELPLGDGSTFCPLQRAAGRWLVMAGQDQVSKVLYELDSGEFVIVEPDGSANPCARRVRDREAASILRNYDAEFPERLHRFHDPAEWLKSEKPPRPLVHWAGKHRLAHDAGVSAHEVDALSLTKAVIQTGIELVQALRVLRPSNMPQTISAIPEFVGALFGEYRVVPDQWWGSKDSIPPAAVDVLSIRWPDGTKDIQNALTQLRELTRIPLTVSTTNGFRLGDSDWPTLEEQRVAQDTLQALTPEIERLVVELRRAIRHFESGQVLADLQDEGGPLRPPNSDEIMAYRMRFFSDQKYETIAESIAPLIGRKVHPGTIQRWCERVSSWCEKGNVLPNIDPPPRKKASPIDPAVIEKGKRMDGLTPRQRKKPSE
jgi:hypothetical protein